MQFERIRNKDAGRCDAPATHTRLLFAAEVR